MQTESIAFFTGPGESARSAVRFINGTGQTLPAGTLAVFGAGGFAGETLLDRLKPGERRFLRVGNDLDAAVTPKDRDLKEHSRRLTFSGDRLDEHYLATSTLTWELENRSGSPRTLYVGLAADRNATVTGTDRVDFDEIASRPIVVFDATPRSKITRRFVVVEGLARGIPLDSLTEKLARDLAAKTSIAAPELATLAQAEPRIRALESEHAKVGAAAKASADAQADLNRLHEHLKALGGGEGKGGAAGTAAAPLVKRVLEAEDRLEAARKDKEAATKELEKRREAVREILRKLGTK